MWTTLVDALREIGAVEAREPHGLVVLTRVDGAATRVELVITPQEWDDLVGILWGDVDAAAEHVRGLVRGLPPGHRFLVCAQYELVPCRTPELPPDPDLVRLQELAAQHPDGVIPGAYWSAFPSRDDPGRPRA